ncbi:hypothetical protein LOC67_09150 [Stieleria sp. JC731]|uniref:hypothetical protein n=1 Tax=Pirellulaceae TaxID=2691357 RepID=UPI001E39765B|nr:hypothetical protein [Stieleria sp. JC731]MCC9600729.1 hypothetical protein [Stieleria sp. JC731]
MTLGINHIRFAIAGRKGAGKTTFFDSLSQLTFEQNQVNVCGGTYFLPKAGVVVEFCDEVNDATASIVVHPYHWTDFNLAKSWLTKACQDIMDDSGAFEAAFTAAVGIGMAGTEVGQLPANSAELQKGLPQELSALVQAPDIGEFLFLSFMDKTAYRRAEILNELGWQFRQYALLAGPLKCFGTLSESPWQGELEADLPQELEIARASAIAETSSKIYEYVSRKKNRGWLDNSGHALYLTLLYSFPVFFLGAGLVLFDEIFLGARVGYSKLLASTIALLIGALVFAWVRTRAQVKRTGWKKYQCVLNAWLSPVTMDIAKRESCQHGAISKRMGLAVFSTIVNIKGVPNQRSVIVPDVNSLRRYCQDDAIASGQPHGFNSFVTQPSDNRKLSIREVGFLFLTLLGLLALVASAVYAHINHG